MCGRYGFIPTRKTFARFEIENVEAFRWASSYNIAPSSINPVITMNGPKRLELMKWGLVPFWWQKDPSNVGFSNINARIEDIENKAFFREPFKKRRCLILASFFYEWALTDNPKIKEPYLFKRKDGEAFALAGIYDVWTDSERHTLKTYSIITTESNEVVAKVHTRMPVILKQKHEEEWADNKYFDLVTLKGICKPYPANEIEAYHVSRAVGSPRNDSPALIEPVPNVSIKPSRPQFEE